MSMKGVLEMCNCNKFFFVLSSSGFSHSEVAGVLHERGEHAETPVALIRGSVRLLHQKRLVVNY
jgi:hypothetical protein